MRQRPPLLVALAFGALLGVGTLYAQPAPPPAPAPGPAGPARAPGPPDVTAPGETRVNLSPRDMATETKRLLVEMEGYHLRVLQLQGAARKSKDVIKLNCVNEKLLAAKQLLNIAETAETDLTEAIASSDRDAQVHQFSQVKLAHERATQARDEAQNCIGEEIIFVGPTQVETDAPPMPDDPTDDPDDPFSGTVVEFESVAYATPFT